MIRENSHEKREGAVSELDAELVARAEEGEGAATKQDDGLGWDIALQVAERTPDRGIANFTVRWALSVHLSAAVRGGSEPVLGR